jgi:hypothetical protein
MDAYDEIKAFLAIAEVASLDAAVRKAEHIRDLPEPLQDGLAKAIKAVIEARYERQVIRTAAEVVASVRGYPGGLGEAIQALTHVLIDNDAFELSCE